VEFLCINSYQLATSVKSEALMWMQAISDAMVNLEIPKVKEITERMDKWVKLMDKVCFKLTPL